MRVDIIKTRMCFELYNSHTAISRKFSRQTWTKALELARLYGWKPMGTHHPDCRVDWLGTYSTNDGQTVLRQDAFLIAAALEKSLKNISEENLQLDWNPGHWTEDDLPDWLSPEEREIIEDELQDGLLDINGTTPIGYFAGDEKYCLIQLIRFCHLGSFEIL
jgi:hypothetical protein